MSPILGSSPLGSAPLGSSSGSAGGLGNQATSVVVVRTRADDIVVLIPAGV